MVLLPIRAVLRELMVRIELPHGLSQAKPWPLIMGAGDLCAARLADCALLRFVTERA